MIKKFKKAEQNEKLKFNDETKNIREKNVEKEISK